MRKVAALAAAALLVTTSIIGPPAQTASAQQLGDEVAEFCRELVAAGEVPFTTVGECVSTAQTFFNQGQAQGVGFCKLFFAFFDIDQRFMGQCVRLVQGGQAG